ncbi:MAG: hypothetical protein KBT58_02450 [Bizionia sp.]|nr:hypothetical protein [Bizionia sp.]
MKKNVAILFLFFLCLLSCNDSKGKKQNGENTIEVKEKKELKDLNYHLANGLKELDNSYGVEQKFNDEVYLRSFGFYEKGENQYALILELQDDIVEDVVSKYTFAVEGFAANNELTNLSEYAKNKNRKHEAWIGTPKLTKINKRCYVVLDVKTKVKSFELLKFFLYDSRGYKGDIGERILFYDYKIK